MSNNFAIGNRVLWLDPTTQEEKKGVIKQLFKNSCKLTLSPSLDVVKANLEDLALAPPTKPDLKFGLQAAVHSAPLESPKSQVREQSIIYLNLTEIRIDGGTQARVACQQQHIFSLVDALAEDAELEPIAVMFDGCDYWLVDGFHRYFAYKSESREIIPALVSPGTQRDAIFASIAANSEHRALPRTRADKRKAVETLLLDEEWRQWSDREIARQARVDHKTVAAIRKVLDDFVEGGKKDVGNSPLAPKSRKYVNGQGTVSQWTDSKEIPENVPPLPMTNPDFKSGLQAAVHSAPFPNSDLKIGDRVVSTYSPNLVGKIIALEDGTHLVRVKWEKTRTASYCNLSDLKKVSDTEVADPKPLEIDVSEVILGFVSNLDQMSPEQVRDVFVNSLDRLTEAQTKEIFQSCVKRLGEFKEKQKIA